MAILRKLAALRKRKAELDAAIQSLEQTAGSNSQEGLEQRTAKKKQGKSRRS